MLIEVSETELDYLYRLMVARPMAEVEPLVIKVRAQVARQLAPQTKEAPAGLPEGAATRPNGAGDGDGLPALP